ncbi:MAG TPA: PAS domain-containing protein [Pseudobdellovibrionaceae bacterium]|nr:PAS domain-containing protein [Pseudobdellovibrionaceae bacterium]
MSFPKNSIDFSNLFSSLSPYLFITLADSNGNIFWATDAYNKLAQHPKKNIINQNLRSLFLNDFPTDLQEKYILELRSGTPWRGPCATIKPNNEKYEFESFIYPIWNDLKQNGGVRNLV